MFKSGRLLERGGHAAGLLLLQCDIALSRDLQRRARLLADLVAGGSKWRELRERGNEIEFDVEHPALVAVFYARPLDCTEFLRRLAHSAAPHSILLEAEQGYVVAILPGYDAVKLNALVTRLGDLLALPVFQPVMRIAIEPVSMAATAAGKAIDALRIIMAVGSHGSPKKRIQPRPSVEMGRLSN